MSNMVEWKKLGEVCEIVRGNRVTKSDLVENGAYPVISGGVSPLGFIDKYNREANTITIAQYGSAGYVDMQLNRFWANDVCYSLYPNEGVINPFLYYSLKNKQREIYVLRTNAVPAHLPQKDLLNLELPIPSISEQSRIVSILDTFTSSISNLKQQIEERRKQYEYERDRLLDLEGKEGVEMKKLGEIGDVCMCKRIMKDQTSDQGNIPFFKIGTFGGKADAYISRELFEEYKEKYSYPKKGDILISAAGTIGRTVVFNGEDAYFQDSNIVWINNSEDLVHNSFLRYLYGIIDWKIDGGTIKRLYNYNLKNAVIPVPSLSEQSRIVSILDTFEASIKNLEEQLALREKQYEYYRNKLLTFE